MISFPQVCFIMFVTFWTHPLWVSYSMGSRVSGTLERYILQYVFVGAYLNHLLAISLILLSSTSQARCTMHSRLLHGPLTISSIVHQLYRLINFEYCKKSFFQSKIETKPLATLRNVCPCGQKNSVNLHDLIFASVLIGSLLIEPLSASVWTSYSFQYNGHMNMYHKSFFD